MFDNNVMQIHHINNFRIELHTGTEQGEERSDCTITIRTEREPGDVYNEFGASLQCLECDGGLYNDREDFYPVAAHIIDLIYKWAEDNGY